MNTDLAAQTAQPARVADAFEFDERSSCLEAEIDARVAEIIADFLGAPEVAFPAPHLHEAFGDSTMPETPIDPEHYFATLAEDVVPYASRIASPRSLAHMSQGLPWFSRPLARLVTALNQNLTKCDASRSLTLCERQALATMHRQVFAHPDHFYDRHAQQRGSTLGIVTSGGTLANLTATWCARNVCLGPAGTFAGIEREGLGEALRFHGYRNAVVIGPESMHYSFAKAVGLMGLGERGLIRVPLDASGRVDVNALRQAVAAHQAAGTCVLAIVGVAGSTDAGALDPLNELADIAEQARVPFHVDAAWGGPLLFSLQQRHKLAGIERADSVTLDGHKQLYLPLGIGMVVFRDPQRAQAIEKHAQYLSRPGSADLGLRSLEGSRPGMALHLHAALRLFGRRGYAELIEHGIRMARRFAEQITHSADFELLVPEPDTNVILYRYVPPALRDRLVSDDLTDAENAAINRCNERLHRAQRAAGRTCVSRTTLHCTRYGRGRPVVALRAVVANPRTTESDLAAVLDDQQVLAAELCRE